jgi:hypothetical protein
MLVPGNIGDRSIEVASRRSITRLMTQHHYRRAVRVTTGILLLLAVSLAQAAATVAATKASGGDTNTTYCERYRIAEFVPKEGWSVNGNSLPPFVKKVDLQYVQPHGMKILYSFNESPGRRKVPIRLHSPTIRSIGFASVDAVVLRLAGNSTPDRLRVTVVDGSGETFTTKTRIDLTFNQPIEAELSLAPGNYTHAGGNNNGIMDPPLNVQALKLISSPAGADRPVVMYEMAVTGVPLADGMDDEKCIKSPTGEKYEGKDSNDTHGRKIDPRVFRMPMKVMETRYVDYYPEKQDKAIRRITITARMCNELNRDSCTSRKSKVAINDAGYFRLPVTATSPGYYTLKIDLSNEGVPIPSRLESELFVWKTINTPNRRRQDHFFGVMASFDNFPEFLEKDASLMRDAGVNVVRFPFRWPRIEKGKARIRWNLYDRIFETLARFGLTPQPTIIQTPAWARREMSGLAFLPRRYNKEFIVPASLEEFSTFVRESANRYSKYHPVWQIWNEPQAPQYWIGGNEEYYVELLEAGYKAVKSVDRDGQVLVAGLGVFSKRQREYTEYILEHGSSDFDAFALHTHGTSARLEAALTELKKLFQENDRKYDVWINETGIAIDPARPDGELVRASEFVKKAVIARYQGVANLTWFIFRQKAKSLQRAKDNFAMLGEDDGPRPVLTAYNNLAALLSDASVSSPVLTTTASYSYAFRRENEQIQVFWNSILKDDQRIKVELPSASDDFELIDMFGGKVSYELNNNVLSALSDPEYPVFLIRKP